MAVLLIASLIDYTIRRARRVLFANIGEGAWDNGKASFLYDTNASPVTGTRFLLVKKGATANVITTTTTNDVPVGIATDAFDANNTDVPISVNVLGGTPGLLRVVTDGTIADGNYVKCGTLGQATLATTGDAGIFGIARFGTDTTSAAGDVITVATSMPAKYSF
jgi:hypothetical protein